MFHYVDNKMRGNSVIRFSDQGVCKEPPAQQVIGALELCLSWNNVVFNNTNYIQRTQLKVLICSEGDWFDIVMVGHDGKNLVYDFPPKVWKWFRDNAFVIWTQDTAKLPSFLNYLNNIDDTGKLKLITQIFKWRKWIRIPWFENKMC